MNFLRSAQKLLILLTLCLTACGSSKKLGYEIRGREVYYRYTTPGKVIPGVWAFENETERLVQGADGKTFQIIDSLDYAKDAKQVFYKGDRIPGADAATFQLVYGDYAKDARQVYSGSSVIAGADPATLEIIWEGILRDKRDWYVKGDRVNIRDMASLKMVVNLKKVSHEDDNIWAYDKYNYYVGGYLGIKSIPIADPATFQIMKSDNDYAKDAKQVYYVDHIVEGADVATFQALGYRYAKDAQRAYYRGYVFDGADVQTLQAVGRGELYTGYHPYAKDAKHVYSGMGVVEGADVATFVADDNGARDKNKRYQRGMPVKESPKAQ